jgi:hypothetical protein
MQSVLAGLNNDILVATYAASNKIEKNFQNLIEARAG